MPRRNDIAKIGAVFAVLLLGGMLIKSDACSIEFESIHMAPSFRILVKQAQNPVSGTRIAIYHAKGPYQDVEKEPFLKLTTDSDGSAKVNNLPDGYYVVEMAGPGGASVAAVVGSKAKGKIQHSFVFDWPALTPIIKTSRLVGRLLHSNERQPFEKIVSNAQLELWTPGGQAPIATGTTDADGRFSFEENSPGVYVLRFSTTGKFHGDVALDLSPTTLHVPDFLNLHLTENSCGLQYRRCATLPVDVTSREIRIVASKEGRLWTDADYRLESPQGGLLATGRTDDHGMLELPRDVSGLAELRLAKYLVAIEQPIRVMPSTTSNAPQPVVFLIQDDDVCSHLMPENYAPSQ